MGFMQQPHSQTLIQIPTVELHQVQNGQQYLMCAGGLQVLEMQGEAGTSIVAQVGNISWMLRKGLPCLQVTACVYTFIVNGLQEGAYFILVVEPRTPDCVLEALEGVLCSCTTFHVSTNSGYYTVSQPGDGADGAVPQEAAAGSGVLVPVGSSATTTDKVVSGIQSGAQTLGAGIVKAARAASTGIEKGTEYIVQHTKPRSNPIKVSAETQERIRQVGSAAATAGKVAGTAAVFAADITAGVACALADRVAKSDMARKMAKSEFATSNHSALKSAQKVGGATVIAAGHLLQAMEAAGRIVLSSAGNATTAIVEHKYGPEAGLAAKGSSEAAGSMLDAALAMRKLGTRALVRAMAKNMGAELLQRPKWGPSSSMPARCAAAGEGSGAGSLARGPGLAGQLLGDERVLHAVVSAGPAVASAAARSGLLNDGRVVGGLAEHLVAKPSSFGRGGKAVLDPSYRSALELQPDSFALNHTLPSAAILADVHSVLQPNAGAIEAQLYKLNIYAGPDGHFKSHVDTPRSDTMFGSLVICLPCSFEVGQLQLRHNGATKTCAWGGAASAAAAAASADAGSASSASSGGPCVQWAAFFSDVEHWIEPVTSGYRITLTYNLLQQPAVASPNQQLFRSADLALTTPLYAELKRLLETHAWHPMGARLGFFLEHHYDMGLRGLREDMFPGTLKGNDRLLYAALSAVGVKAAVVPVHIGWDEYEREPVPKRLKKFFSNKQRGEESGRKEADEELEAFMRSRIMVGPNLHTAVDRMECATKYEASNREVAEQLGGRPASKMNIIWCTHIPDRRSCYYHDYIAGYGNEPQTDIVYSSVGLLVNIPPWASKQRTDMIMANDGRRR